MADQPASDSTRSIFRTPGTHDRDATVFSAYAAAVRAAPDAVAVVSDAGEMTHAQVRDAALAAAARLRAVGVRPGDRVAFLCERHPLVPAAMLGVMAAGAVFVPVETDAPAERQARVMARAACRAVITNLPVARRPDQAIDLAGLCAPGPLATPTPLGPDDPASVMFTSGSTGEPKGVVIPHRAIVRLAGAGILPAGPGHRFLQASSLAFDASTLEIWAPLLNGGATVVVPGTLNLAVLAETLRRHRVTTAWMTAALFHLCVDTQPDLFGTLRHVITGGDVVSPAHAARLLARHPHLVLINGYGPTENTTFTTCHHAAKPDPARPLPIGRPIAGTGVIIADEDLRPVPVGETGELLATGDGLALGYLDDDRLTAERFPVLPDGTRAYRTGDLARARPDGEIEFLGRADRQVKIRGFRVEPAEVETVLRHCPGVLDAAVVTVRTGDSASLHAFVTTDRPETWPDHRAAIAERLAETLPDYLVPASLARLDRIPLNASGKADRTQLETLIVRGEPVPTAAAPTPADLAAIAAIAGLLWHPWAPGEAAEVPDPAHAEPLPRPDPGQTFEEVVRAAEARTDRAETIIIKDPEGEPAAFLLDGGLRLRLHPGASETLRRWRREQVRRIAEAVLERRRTPIGETELMGDDERDAVAGRWAEHAADLGEPASIPELLARVAGEHPDHAAIISESGTLTFRTLLRRLNAVAAQLRGHGVKPGDRVAVVDRRSTESVVAALGVLHAGAVCVPLNPDAPGSRAEQALRIAGPVLTLDPAAATPGAHAPTQAESDDPPPSGPAPGDDAYVLFTSGSTGEPKAVALRHESIVNTMRWHGLTVPLGPDDRVAQRSSLAWDCSILECLWPMFNARPCVVVACAGVAELKRDVDRFSISITHLVPSLLARFGGLLEDSPSPSLRAVICVGEKLHPRTARAFRRAHAADLYNFYGPTETAVVTTWWKAPPAFDEVPIGRPGANCRVTITDPAGRPCPAGVAGEVRIAGVQVSRRYLNASPADEERFVTPPDARGTEYRTGDLARWREDGAILFDGRADHQLKIMGFRVEAGEIEAAILGEGGAREAAVCVTGDDQWRELVAVCAPAPDDATLHADRLSTRLRERLEPHAVPTRFVWADALPRLPSGKVDRSAVARLAERAADGPGVGAGMAAVVEVWRRVLGRPPASPTTSFIQAGGNSLALLRLYLLLETELGARLRVFPSTRDPTPADVLAAFERNGSADHDPAPGQEVRANRAGHLIRLADGREPLVALPHLAGTIGFLAPLPDALQGRYALHAVTPAGLMAGETPLDSVDAMVRGYADLIRAQGWPRVHLLGFSSGATLTLELAGRLSSQGVTVGRVFLIDGLPCHRPPPPERWMNLYRKVHWRIPARFVPFWAPGTHRYTPELYEGEQRDVATATLRALFRHTPVRYAGPATLIVSDRSPRMARLPSWRRMLTGPVDEVLVPGAGHKTFWQPPYFDRIAEAILAYAEEHAGPDDADPPAPSRPKPAARRRAACEPRPHDAERPVRAQWSAGDSNP